MHLNLNLKQVFTKYLYFIYKQKQPNLLEHFNSVDLFYFISVKLTTHLTRDRDKREVGKAGITVATVDRVPGLSHSTVDAENEPEPLWDRLVNSTVRKHHRSRCVHSVHTAHRNCPPEGVTLSWWRADPPPGCQRPAQREGPGRPARATAACHKHVLCFPPTLGLISSMSWVRGMRLAQSRFRRR